MDDDGGAVFAWLPFLLGRWGGAYLLAGIVVMALVRILEPQEPSENVAIRLRNELAAVSLTIVWPFVFAGLFYAGFRSWTDRRKRRV